MIEKKTSRESTILALRAVFDANVKSFERLESTRREAGQFFASVSDCVFLFAGEKLDTANEEANKLIQQAGGSRERILRALIRLGTDHADELPVQLEFRAASGRPLFVSVRNATRFEVDGQVFQLVTAENQTAIEALEAECERIAVDERRRIGRNLHDGLSQLLTSLSLQISAQSYAEKDPRIRKEWEEILKIAQHCLRNQAIITQRLENAEG